MRYYCILLLTIFTSCKATQDLVEIKYITNTLKAWTYIPEGFKKEIIESGQDIEYRFVYNDSSMIYITDEKGTPTLNYKNIENDSSSLQKSFLSLMENDTLTLHGKDNLGKFWKNKKLKELSIGYLNVNENQKIVFDKAISLIKIKQ
ncbi:hypothetical protein [Flagellimonas beolgyonensis]|uniref:hypothetical protein n=1 Tax=Flagellimonas beolgyonensis TaxID=864064 RepID=UPI003D65EE49